MAACLAWGPGAAASHSCAAALWGMIGFRPGPVILTVPRHRKRALPTQVHRWSRPDARQITKIGQIPVTCVERTLLDLAASQTSDTIEETLDDALRRGMATPVRLQAILAVGAQQRRPGVGLLRQLLKARAFAELAGRQ